jgi:hypothetical protein
MDIRTSLLAMTPWWGQTMLCSMDNQWNLPLESFFAFPYLRVFIIEEPRILLCPNTPAHNYDDLHCKWQSQSSYDMPCGSLRLQPHWDRYTDEVPAVLIFLPAGASTTSQSYEFRYIFCFHNWPLMLSLFFKSNQYKTLCFGWQDEAQSQL